MSPILQDNLSALLDLCRRYHVARLEVFDSVIRDDFVPGQSDIDFLAGFLPVEGYDLVDAYFGLLEGLRALLDCKVDLVMAGAVKNPYFAAELAKTTRLLYAA